ncbi:MAG: MFS transporter [Ignavibacteria bacterium]
MHRNVAFVFSISLMTVVGIVAITPALPLIATDLNISKEKIGILVSVFTLPGIILTPLLGVISDKFGCKLILFPSVFIPGFFSVLSFFARDFHLLIIFRFLSGIGAAPLGAINITLIGDLFNKDKREKILGYNNSVLNLGITVFPFLAGILANFHWSLVFVLPSLALLIFIWLLLSFKEKIPIQETPENYIRNFVIILKNKDLIKIFFINFLTYIVLFGSLWTYLPLLMVQKFNTEPFVIGITLSSMSLTTSIFSLFLVL